MLLLLERVTPQERLRLCNRFNAAIRKAERGKLATSKLFGLIVKVWSLNNRPPKKTGNEQVDAENQLELAHRVNYERALARRLLQAVIMRDVGTLHEAAQVVDQLNQFEPRHDQTFAPVEQLHRTLLTYFRSHDTGTIEELLKWVSPRMHPRWIIGQTGELGAYDKQIRRACKRLGIPIAKSKPGPKSKN